MVNIGTSGKEDRIPVDRMTLMTFVPRASGLLQERSQGSTLSSSPGPHEKCTQPEAAGDQCLAGLARGEAAKDGKFID